MPDGGSTTRLCVWAETTLQESQQAAPSVHGAGGLGVCGSETACPCMNTQLTSLPLFRSQMTEWRATDGKRPGSVQSATKETEPPVAAGLMKATQPPTASTTLHLWRPLPSPLLPAIPRELQGQGHGPTRLAKGTKGRLTTKAPQSPQESPARLEATWTGTGTHSARC